MAFYQSALASGQSEEELEELLAAFLLKCNEICGRTTHNYRQKPIPSHSSKQYVNVGGEDPNAVSVAILRAARRNCMPQPQIVVLWKKDGDEAFSREVFLALEDLTDKMNLYHYDLVRESLLRKGIPEEVAGDFTYSACCTLDLHFHTVRREYYVPVPQIFMETVCGGEYETVEALLSAFKGRLLEEYEDEPVKIRERFFSSDGTEKYLFELSIITVESLEQNKNGFVSIVFIFLPIVTVVNASDFSNENSSITSILSCIVIDVKLLDTNAKPPIVSTVEGIVNDVRSLD